MASISPIDIPTERLRLRFLTPADAPAQFVLFSDPQVMRYGASPPWTDMRQAHRQIEQTLEDYASGKAARLAVELRGELIGNVSLYDLDAQNRRCDLGYFLSPAHQGRGYMSEALRAAFGLAFDGWDLNRIEADVDPRNAASIQLLERLGFQREGYMPERWIVNGEICDTAFYGLLRKRWQQMAR
ncbi:MAG TPA: GNAT family protein [Telluria sp.]|nr:GNAT family protein [Telluria sp.]